MTVKSSELTAVKGSGIFHGVVKNHQGIEFTISSEGIKALVLNIYLKDGRHFRIGMNEFHVFGNVYSVLLVRFNYKYFEYTYEYDHVPIKDEYAGALAGREKWGTPAGAYRYCFWNKTFDWEDDAPLGLQSHELVMYKLHVRGFTKHPSSGVRHKGTFLGVAEKIGHLKKLGINCVELMPVVSFDELSAKNSAPYQMAEPLKTQYRMNYWGYGDAHYFAPKAAYSAGGNPQEEFKTMVLKLHQAGIEVVLDIVFDGKMNKNVLLDCLRYWVLEYHVDGFHVNSNVVPVNLAATDAVLSKTKLFTEGFDISGICGNKPPYFKHLAEYHDEYAVCCRRFLKGDEDMVKPFCRLLTKNTFAMSSVRYICNHNGFRLADLVSFDEKHNKENGENNNDGTDYNYSWNCGEEGPTRKRKVKELRMRQMKNAWIFNAFHMGIPLIFAGDEFGQSQGGNNNPYCLDNKVTWLNWKNLAANAALFDFAAAVLALRKAHPVLCPPKPVRLMDYLSCGYPDISFHGAKPWKVEELPSSRYLGVLYSGRYAHENGRDDDSFYFAYNMHWEPKIIGLPALPKNMVWEKVISTDMAADEVQSDAAEISGGDTGGLTRVENMVIGPRTITIYQSRLK